MNFWNSLTGRLFKLVFGWYLVLAISVTAVQLVLEYSSISRDINADLESLGRSFAPTITDTLWTFDKSQLDIVVNGIVETAYITGVRIESNYGESIAQSGEIPSRATAPGEGLLAPYQLKRFPLNIKTPRGEQKLIGQLFLYSDRSVALERIEYSFFVILINSLIKTAGLWLIFYLVISRALAQPLRDLTELVSRVEFAADAVEPVALDYPHQDELGRLLSAMRKMQDRVTAARQEVININWRLEETVAERTRSLREQEIKYRTLFETANDGIFLQDTNGFVDCNERGAAMYGLSREQLIGRSPAEFCPERQPNGRLSSQVAAEIMRASLKGLPQVFEWQSLRADGAPFDVEITLNRLELSGATYLQAIVRDITERKRAEESLRESEEKLRGLFDLSPLGIALTDMDGHYVEFNEAFRRFCGYPAEELRNLDYWTLTPKRYEAQEAVQLDSLSRTGCYGPYEKEYRRKDGTLIPLRLNGMLVTGANGQPYIWSIVEDITESKRAEEELQHLNATLDQRVHEEVAKNMEQERLLIQQSRLAAMGEMIGNIAHQWRQPLVALGLVLANIKDAYKFNELDQEVIDDSVRKGNALINKMSSTIEDFRNFFKPNKEKERFQLEKSVRETQELLDHSFKNYNITVRLENDPGNEVVGFPNEFSQVLLNIFSNSKDAIVDRDIMNGVIEVTFGHDMENAWVTIRDNAGGIPEDILPKVFDPYFTTKEKGTGIGLYMSKIIIESHMNGRIEVRNIGDGAEFTIRLPIRGME